MQSLLVLPFDKADYVHEDEVVQIQHLASKVEYEVLVKDLDPPGLLQGKTGIMVPLVLVEDLIVKDGYLSLVLAHNDGKDQADLWAELEATIDQLRSRTMRSDM